MLFLGAVAYDPFQFLYESGAVYAYGTAVPEDHDTTRETLGAWLYAFCAGMDWGWTRRDCVALRDATFEKMFFTNVFARELGAAIGICLDAELKISSFRCRSRTAFWLEPPVERLLWELDRTSGVLSVSVRRRLRD